MKGQKYLYGEMTWAEINEAVAQKRVALLPTGSIEVHGPHLPLDTDAVIAFGVCRHAAERMPDRVVVLPPVSFGICPYHVDFPGSISIDYDTFMAYVFNICQAVVYHGLTRMLLVNAHGGNHSALDIVAKRINVANPGALCASVSYYLMPNSRTIRREVQEPDVRGSMSHGGIVETSLYLALNSNPVDMAKAVTEKLPPWSNLGFSTEDAPVTTMPFWSAITSSGVLGDATRASVEIGRRLLDAAAEDLKLAVEEMARVEPGARVDHHVPRKF
ncbi:MAG: creatininase family protein [Armatimonadetes bacterium]|nr:creatininase family protein [Armatimonadota bacterium]